jgi:hypothetical protein
VQRLVLHIGTEKTGTSTIQRFLHSNRDRLLAEGWTLPRSLGEPDQRHLAALCNDDVFVDAFLRRRGLADSRMRSKARRAWSDAFAKELAAAATPNMVISSEHLSSRLFTPTEMERVRQFLAPYFERIDIMVLLRDPLAAALSLVSTQVQTGYTRGSLPPPPTTWGDGNDRSWISVCDHRQTLQRWEAAFPGRLTVRLYERDGLAGGSILTEMRTILGIGNTSGYAEPERINESLSANGIALLAALNARIPMFVDGQPNRYRGDLSAWVARFLRSGERLTATPEQRAAYATAFAESNEWVRARYFPERTTLFTPTPSIQHDRAPSKALTEEEIADIADLIAVLWKSQAGRRSPNRTLGGIGHKLRSIGQLAGSKTI